MPAPPSKLPRLYLLGILFALGVGQTEARSQSVCTPQTIDQSILELSSGKTEREKAMAELGKCGQAAMPKLLDLLKKTNPDMGLQLGASKALAKVGTGAIDDLTKLVKDGKAPPVARQLAITSLSEIARSHPQEAEKIRETLKGRTDDAKEDPSLRLRAGEALETISPTTPFWKEAVKLVKAYPQIATGAGTMVLLSLGYLGILWYKPRWLLQLPAKFTIPSTKIEIPLGLLRWLKYRPRVLDSWVSEQLPRVKQTFLGRETVEQRQIHIPITIKYGKDPVDQFTPQDLQSVFQHTPVCLLIVGEGGTGKTSLACQIARWGLEGKIGHPMLPVLIEEEFKDTALLTQIRSSLPLSQDGSFLPDELLEALLKQKRVLVILDHVSEMGEATYNQMRQALEAHPINAAIITSRLKEKNLARPHYTLLEPQKIEGAKLSSFISPYLEQKGQKDIFADDAEFYRVCTRLSSMMAATLQSTTALLAKMYVEQVIAVGGLRVAQLPDNIPDLILQYLCRLNRYGHRPDIEVQKDGKLVAWQCLKDTYLPSSTGYEEVVQAIAVHRTNGDGNQARERLEYLITTLRLVQRSESADQVRITLDPVAEYLAALELVEYCQEDPQNNWQDFWQTVDAKPDLLQIRGFLLAVRNCCEQKAKNLPQGILEELNRRANLNPEELEQARRRQRIDRLIDNLEDEDPKYQAQAIRNLREEGEYAKRAIPDLEKMINSPTLEANLRVQALNALMDIQMDREKLRGFYRNLLGDRQNIAQVRVAAMKNLLALGQEADLIQLLRKYFDDVEESAAVRLQAGEGLRKLKAITNLLVVTLSEDATPTFAQLPPPERHIIELPNAVGLIMVKVPGGRFQMGSPEGEGYNDEKPQHEVTVPEFWMGQYAIAQEQYEAVMGTNPSAFQSSENKNLPVERVAWHEAVAFCQRLSELSGRDFRLPSEAEWEYACRAETITPFHYGATITTDLANYRGTDWNYGGRIYSGAYGQGPKGIFREETTEVGSFPPNAFGLYDMHGNVWEWCEDDWHDSYNGAPVDGRAWLDEQNSQQYKCLRGGSSLNHPVSCRSANRYWYDAGLTDNDIGFRVVCGSPGLSVPSNP